MRQDHLFARPPKRPCALIPANTRRLIITKIEQYAVDPVSLANNVKALKGELRYFRLRVGDWRVIFRDDGVVLFVTRVATRGSAYD